MLPTTAAYRAALPYAHGRVTLVRVFHGTEDVTPPGGIELSEGDVTASLNSRVTRVANLSLPATYFPWETDDLLSPDRATLRISTGIRHGDGTTEMFDVFTGRVATPARTTDRRCALRADDLAADVVAQRFDTAQSTIPGTSTVAEIRRFIAQVLPDAVTTFDPGDVTDQPVPDLTWDDDRGAALDDLASSVQGRWYFLGDGTPTVRRYPYAGQVPALRIADGEPDGNGGGLLSEAEISRTRDGVANSVTVISERIDGSGPVYATVRDTSSGSPTLYGPLYGRVNAILRPQSPLGQAAAETLARQTLTSTTALGQQWNVEIVPDASLEPGDVILLQEGTHSSVQVIDTIVYPLTTTGSMRLSCRSVSMVEGVTV